MRYLIFTMILFVTSIVSAQNSIIGTWNNDEMGTLVFYANGNGSFAGGDFTYTSTSNKIFAHSDDGDFSYTYKFVNGELIISGGIFPQPVAFTKMKAGSNSTNAGNTKSGSIDKSIVGTWCWTNASGVNTNATSSNTRCIVFNSDGTYQYTYEGSISGSNSGYYGGSASQSADHGTWKLNGNSISVISASAGAITYSFQKKNHPKTGDPMIIINGDAYVTYYQRSPW